MLKSIDLQLGFRTDPFLTIFQNHIYNDVDKNEDSIALRFGTCILNTTKWIFLLMKVLQRSRYLQIIYSILYYESEEY